MIQLVVNENWQCFITNFYLREQRGNETIIIGQKDGLLVEQTKDRTSCSAAPVIPLLSMPSELANEFIKAVVDYASSKNIKTVNENLLQGKLAATEKHLEDLRNYSSKLLDKVIKTN